MDIERRIELIMRPPTEEIITVEELRQMLETKDKLTAYNGWEPSGLVHLGTGMICAYKMKDLIQAGIKFKAYLATWHALINNKLGGDINMIRMAAEHFKHAWISLGIQKSKIEFIDADEAYENSDYWSKVVNVARKMTIARTVRTLEISGRTESDARYVSDFMYTPMQVADVFQFEIDICQLGTDQRKANIVARELGESLGYWKPINVHHHLLQGLAKPPVWPIPEEQRKEALASIKMSKSKPETALWIYDEPEQIKEKINNAFCPEKILQDNPIADLVKFVIFREVKVFSIDRPIKYGGRLDFSSYEEFAKHYQEGKIHPLDLKNAVAGVLIKALEPARRYFKRNKSAKESLEVLKKAKITR